MVSFPFDLNWRMNTEFTRSFIPTLSLNCITIVPSSLGKTYTAVVQHSLKMLWCSCVVVSPHSPFASHICKNAKLVGLIKITNRHIHMISGLWKYGNLVVDYMYTSSPCHNAESNHNCAYHRCWRSNNQNSNCNHICMDITYGTHFIGTFFNAISFRSIHFPRGASSSKVIPKSILVN